MKKSLLVFLLVTVFALFSNAQIIKSWDFEDGALGSWKAWSGTAAVLANPSTDGNSSALCGQLNGNAWDGFALWDPTALTSACTTLKVDVYKTAGGMIQIWLGNPASSGAAIYTKQITNIPAAKWTTLEFDLSKLTAYDYQQIGFQTDAADIIYFDNVKLIGANGEPQPVVFSEVTITKETFGTKQYGTDNPTPSVSGGWGSGAAWHWNWYDVTTFSSTNGYFESGSDSSIRIVSYLSGSKPAEWLEPSGGMHLLMTATGYSGSWDTLYFKGIDIKNQIVSCVELGWAKRGNMSPKDSVNGLNVEIRIDGGEWIQLDTTKLQNPLGGDKWSYAHLPVNNLKGSKMEIRLACYANQIFIDDIAVKGLEYVESAISKETFGTKQYGTDNPTPSVSGGWGSGAAWHWNWYDVTTFTTKNGYFESGSDSSIRIVSYLSGSKPAEWLEPSGGMHLLMTATGYSGSWDTLYFKGIDIKDQIPSSIQFGWAKRGNMSPKDSINGLNVEISIDGGAWIQLDTTKLQNPLGGDKWSYAILPVPAVEGSKMDIRFACYANQIFIDDILVNGAVPAPKGVNDFVVEKLIFGTIDNANDYTCNLNFKWDTENAYLTLDITDDSLVNKGTNYQVDNIEIYFDMDNSKNIHWPRNGGWVANDATYDANDYQLRLVPDTSFYINNTKPKGVTQVYTETEKGYKFELTIPWDSLMAGFEPALGKQIGFDVLASDNDAVASDANRNQVTLLTPSGMIYNDPSYMATFQFEGMGTFSYIPDEEAPTAPSNLVATASKSQVKLTWDNATDNIAILYYNIYQNDVLIKEKQYATQAANSYTVKNLADGDYTFSIETVDNFGNISAKKASAQATINTVSVYDVNASKLAVYPNPVESVLNINGVENVSRIEVIGITGNIIKATKASTTISVTDLTQGAYFLKVYSDQKVYTTRFVKK